MKIIRSLQKPNTFLNPVDRQQPRWALASKVSGAFNDFLANLEVFFLRLLNAITGKTKIEPLDRDRIELAARSLRKQGYNRLAELVNEVFDCTRKDLSHITKANIVRVLG